MIRASYILPALLLTAGTIAAPMMASSPALAADEVSADKVAETYAALLESDYVYPETGKRYAAALRAGIAALGHSVAAAVVLLGDQPFVTPAIVERLLAAWQNGDGAIVAPVYAGQRGNPVLFARTVFPELLAVQGDQGARSVLAANRERVALVPFGDARPLADIDTPEEYERLRQSAGGSTQLPEAD